VGMGLAVPINKVTGELEADGILPGWHGIRPAVEMEARLGVPVQLDNDANVGALGEKVFGAGRGVDDLVYVRLSAGIGAGLILDGRPYQGLHGFTGEIGHALVDPTGLICRCGNRGCLETVASPVAVAALLERSTGQPVSVQGLLDLVRAEDRGARRAIAEAGEAVGRTLSVLVNILNPELVVVGGELASAGPILLDPIRAAIERHAVAPAAGSVRVTAGTLGDRAEVLGAAGLILARSPHALAQRVEQ
jgi:predicted NBD/HSP70 family sugar kinase